MADERRLGVGRPRERNGSLLDRFTVRREPKIGRRNLRGRAPVDVEGAGKILRRRERAVVPGQQDRVIDGDLARVVFLPAGLVAVAVLAPPRADHREGIGKISSDHAAAIVNSASADVLR